ncbi:MAG: ABC transporter permease, partial [Gemmataceae bacterium]|nr:ABC transporter permease [Gemmataceae bacterium]
MNFLAFIVKNLARRPIRTALTVLGLAVTVGSMIALSAVSHNVEQSVERAFDSRRVDLVVMQKGKPLGLDSEIGEYFVQQTAAMPEVERTSEGVVGNANVVRDSGTIDDNITLIQGWKPDNFGFEDLTLLSGTWLKAGDTRKLMLGVKLADRLKKRVGDTVTFVNDPDTPFEVVAVFKSAVVFEEGGGIVSYEDGQRLHTKKGKVTGFSVRVRKASPDSEAEVAAVKAKIEALRDPNDRSITVTADPPDKYVQSVSQLQLIRAVSWLVSAIAFAVGVITMLNTMAMSVLERTQEIGILRAVGWPRGRVVCMILG